MKEPSAPFSLSVVIIGRNEGERLSRCIASVKRARFPESPVEIIYVDSRSSDGSAGKAESLGVTVISLSGGRPTAARGRNAGWRAAAGEHILFLDGDTILHPDFVMAAHDSFSDPRVVAVSGNRRELHPEASVYNRVLDLDWLSPPGPAAYCGGDALVRRSGLESVNGFSESLIAGEEPELCRRLREKGHLILRLDVPMTGHDLAIHSALQYWRRAVRTGHAYAEVAGRYRNTSDPLWSRECRQSVVRGLFWMFFPLAVLAGALLLDGAVFLFAGALVAAAIILRTAWRARSRSAGTGTLLLYALHSQFVHVPIFLGELGYWLGRFLGADGGLIEYKDGPRRV